jgi:hypothetical protein
MGLGHCSSSTTVVAAPALLVVPMTAVLTSNAGSAKAIAKKALRRLFTIPPWAIRLKSNRPICYK